jgi:hypothetical protein
MPTLLWKIDGFQVCQKPSFLRQSIREERSGGAGSVTRTTAERRKGSRYLHEELDTVSAVLISASPVHRRPYG